MKKRILAGVLGLTLLAGIVTLAGAASQDRALVSLSYLNGAFWSDLKAVVKQEVDRDTSAIYSAAAGQVGQGGGTAGSFTPQSGVNGDVVTGGIGCGLDPGQRVAAQRGTSGRHRWDGGSRERCIDHWASLFSRDGCDAGGFLQCCPVDGGGQVYGDGRGAPSGTAAFH